MRSTMGVVVSASASSVPPDVRDRARPGTDLYTWRNNQSVLVLFRDWFFFFFFPITCSIARYSTRTDKTLRPRVAQTATVVDTASTREMAAGANSLQSRSMRLIDAFKSAVAHVSRENQGLHWMLGLEPCFGMSRLSETTTTCGHGTVKRRGLTR